MTSPHHHEAFYDTIGSTRSLSSQHPQSQHGSLHRTPSRHFETFASQSGLYTAEDHAAARFDARYDTTRLNAATVSAYPYEISGAQTWNASSFGGPSALAAMGGATGRIKTPSRQRSALPAMWTETAPSSLPTVNPLAGMGTLSLGSSQMRSETVGSDPEEELIPTAIVIKNIPFAVKKEQLVQLMTELNLPLPYAFNYHFDNGVFRGLAFANFTTAEETGTVIDHLNGFDLQGRKLRVEYKKMLPLAERERIEREKRERRGQLEEQHRPIQMGQIPQQGIPLSTSPTPSTSRSKPDVDLNDPQTLQFYSQLLLFRDDASREALIFPTTLSPQQRRIVHTLAHHMALAHVSRGNGEQRQVHVFRAPVTSTPSISPPSIPTTVHPVESHQRRTLARATTMDFSDARSEGAGMYSTMGRQAHALLDIPASPSARADAHSRQNLRAAKSFADLRSYTPSPVPSSASFPATLGGNISRYAEYGAASVGSTTPSLTPTATGTTVSASNASESLLVNGLAGVSLTSSLGGNLGVGGASLRDPRDPRGVLVMDRERHRERETERESANSVGNGMGTISRNFGMGYVEESQRNERERGHVVPTRQPRGPDSDRAAGFASRRGQAHGRNSGSELDVQSGVEIVVE
ncbi:Peptidyl-prolyl cis-trans isomerase pin4 [Rhizina undulata]